MNSLSDLPPNPGAPGESPRTGESQLQEFERVAQIGTWNVDLVSGKLTWSDEMFRIYGMPASASGTTPAQCLESVHPQDLPLTQAAYETALRQRTPLDFVHRVMSTEGVKHVRVRGEVACSADGSPRRSYGTAQDVTSSYLHERSLVDREEVLTGVLAAMSEGVVIQGREGEILEANPASLAILGLSREELMGRTSLDPGWRALHLDGSAFPGADHPAMVTLRTGKPSRDQIMGIHDPRRGLRWISINSDPIWGHDAAVPKAVVATFVDITERRSLEARLAENTEQLQDLYDNAPSAYYSLDSGGRFIRINATALRWIGCAASDVIGKATPADFLDAAGRERFHRDFSELKATGAAPGFEANLLTAEGVARRLSLSSTVVTDGSGRFVMSRSVAHDITELHRAREGFKELSREQAAMLESDLIGIVKVRSRRFEWANAGVTRLFGYLPSEIVGQSTRMLYATDEGYQAVGEAVRGERAPGRHFRSQVQMRHKDGQVVWIDVSSVLLSSETGVSLGIFVDITAMRLAEAKRLEVAQLQAENRQARETSRLKSAFLANMSHELRTPLNAVTGFAHLMRTSAIGPDSPRFDRFLSQIESSGRYLQQLVEGILDFATIESGKLEIHPAAVDLSVTVQEILDMLESEVARKGMEVSVEIRTESASLVSDPLRVKQVLGNLIANAVKFSGDRGHVVIRTMPWGPDFLRIEVGDDGIGIAEKDLPRLFTQFEQLSAGNTKSYEGIGLGLALTRQLAEALGGSVGVRSQLGVGSVFHLDLPRGSQAPEPCRDTAQEG